jgi:hypothetical protein
MYLHSQVPASWPAQLLDWAKVGITLPFASKRNVCIILPHKFFTGIVGHRGPTRQEPGWNPLFRLRDCSFPFFFQSEYKWRRIPRLFEYQGQYGLNSSSLLLSSTYNTAFHFEKATPTFGLSAPTALLISVQPHLSLLGNPSPSHRLLNPCSSTNSFICPFKPHSTASYPLRSWPWSSMANSKHSRSVAHSCTVGMSSQSYLHPHSPASCSALSN